MDRRTALGLLPTLLVPTTVLGRATMDDAQAMVKKAIDYYRKNGRDAALKEFSRADGAFVAGELYVTVHALDGSCLAEINPRIRGRNMLEERDSDGRYFTRARVEAAREAASGWQQYKYFNPVTHKIETKHEYWERYDGLVFASGAYRPLMQVM